MLNWRKKFHETEYLKGLEEAAEDVAFERFEGHQGRTQQAAKAAAETIELAEQLAADGNPHKQRLAAIIKDSVVGAVEAVTTGRRETAEEARGAVEADPFSGDSRPSEMSSSPSGPSLDGPPQKALPQAPAEPPRRKRGRPPKQPKG